MFCYKCGNEIPDDSDFCPKCGAKQSPLNNDADVRSEKQEVSSGIPAEDDLSVILSKVGNSKMEVIKAVKDLCGLGLQGSKELVESAPCIIKSGVTQKEAKMIKMVLEDCGAAISVVGTNEITDDYFPKKPDDEKTADNVQNKPAPPNYYAAVVSDKNLSKSEKAIAIILGLVVTVVIIVILVNLFKGADSAIDAVGSYIVPGLEVRNAYLTEYSNTVTIEKAFDNFFTNPKWSTYESEGYKFIAFDGNCYYNDKFVTMRIAFKVIGEKFSIYKIEIDGIELSWLLVPGILEKIYESS